MSYAHNAQPGKGVARRLGPPHAEATGRVGGHPGAGR